MKFNMAKFFNLMERLFQIFNYLNLNWLFLKKFLQISNAISSLDSQWILLQLSRIVETTPCFNEMESFSQILNLAIFKKINSKF